MNCLRCDADGDNVKMAGIWDGKEYDKVLWNSCTCCGLLFRVDMQELMVYYPKSEEGWIKAPEGCLFILGSKEI